MAESFQIKTKITYPINLTTYYEQGAIPIVLTKQQHTYMLW